MIPLGEDSKQNPLFALLTGFLFSGTYKSKLLTPLKTEIPTYRPGFCFAERGGFEPPIPVERYAGLANRWFQPLTHLSGCFTESVFVFSNVSVGVAGFEPATPCSQSRCANRTALYPVSSTVVLTKVDYLIKPFYQRSGKFRTIPHVMLLSLFQPTKE